MLKTLKLLILMVISFSFLTFCKTSGSKTSSSSPKAPTGNTAGDAPQGGPLAPVDPATDSIPHVAEDLRSTISGCVASQGQDPANVPSAEQLASEIQTNGTAAAAAAAIAAQGGTCKEGQTDNCIPADTSVGTTTENPNSTLSHGHMWLFLMVPAAIATAVSAGATTRQIILYAREYRKARAEGKIANPAFLGADGRAPSTILALPGDVATPSERVAAGQALTPSERGYTEVASARDRVRTASADSAATGSARTDSTGSARTSASGSGRTASTVSGAGDMRAPSIQQFAQEKAKSSNHGKFAIVGALATAAFAGVTIAAGSQLRLADSSDPKAVCANNLDLLEARYLNLLGAQ